MNRAEIRPYLGQNVFIKKLGLLSYGLVTEDGVIIDKSYKYKKYISSEAIICLQYNGERYASGDYQAKAELPNNEIAIIKIWKY